MLPLDDILAKMSIPELLNIRNWGASFCFTDWYMNNTWHPLIIAKYGPGYWITVASKDPLSEESKRLRTIYLGDFNRNYPEYELAPYYGGRGKLLDTVEKILERNEMYVILKDLSRTINKEFLSLRAEIGYVSPDAIQTWYWYMTFNNEINIYLEDANIRLRFDRSLYNDEYATEAHWMSDVKEFTFQLSDPNYISKLCDTIRANYQVM